ncbi:MAG: ABC transporter ATP-binding protein [Pseudomonadota bacterium]
MSNPLLKIENLSVQFAVHGTTVDAVRGVSFDIRQGETVALVGESGSGKSVISKAIMGLLPDNASITGGNILFTPPGDGESEINITDLDADSAAMRDLRGGKISIIFQEPMVSLSPLHTIGDQISEALFLHRDVNRSEGIKVTRDMLEMVGFVKPDRALDAYPFELSGGMRQRAMIAMALICHPCLLIADEPTTALDVTIQAQILKLMNRLQRQLNMAVLMITHDLGVVANVADRVVVVYHGEVMEASNASEIFTRPGHPYTQALLKAVPGFDMSPEDRLTPLREIKAEVGDFIRNRESKVSDADPEILKLERVNKSFGARRGAWSFRASPVRIQAVRNVSLTVHRGESLGLVGESGSGKSTLGKLIAHAMLPDDGSIIFNGRNRQYDVPNLDDKNLFRYRCRVQYIFQDPVGSLNPSMTLFDIIREPMVIHELGDMDYQMEMCSELMRLVGLDPRFLRRYPHSFSGGQRQRIGIARALALQPDLLICDEPVSALDVSIQAQVLNLLKDLQQELGLSYLFISHNLAVVDYIADRIAVMYRGRIVEIAPRKSLFANPTHPYTQSLLQAIPVADLEHPLDFDAIAEPDVSIAQKWPGAFEEMTDGTMSLYEISPDHFVRAHAEPAATHV